VKGKIIFILHEIRIVGKLTVFTYPRKKCRKGVLILVSRKENCKEMYNSKHFNDMTQK